MLIEAKEAIVKTAQVEIKTLTVSGKQVTLAVFRQLHEVDAFNGDGTIDGIPWGTVNYFWGKCDPDIDHIHLVLQREDQLCRSCVYRQEKHNPFLDEWAYTLGCDMEELSKVAAGILLRDFLDHGSIPGDLKVYLPDKSGWVSPGGKYKINQYHKNFSDFINDISKIAAEPEKYEWLRADLVREAETFLKEHLKDRSHIELEEAFVKDNREYQESKTDLEQARNNFKASLKAIEALPQLFIAV